MTSRFFFSIVAASAMAFAHAAPSKADALAEKPLRESLDRLAQAWNTGDGAMWANEYWPEGELVNILGGVMPNAEAIRERHTAVLAGPFKGSHFESTVRHIQFLGPDVAVVDTDIRVTHFQALPRGAVATSPGVLLTRMKHVYQRREGTWHIIASQNTAVLPTVDAPLTASRPGE
ncbi:SgcJ/EcaC family oxidoreductase [Luteibacter sp. dw_328]|uniref:SgcJ/EcaC family oxidoreductase n=1 Tax=Luteibacter sp. dw_328 TaxID=2719796 RepID=UPI001BD3533E|nr:SgcJ/EcaC family oxidoreductase [Luteibacter sp. dw_328]